MSLWDFARLAGSQDQSEADLAWQLAAGLLEAGVRDGLALTPGAGLIWHNNWLAISILADVARVNSAATDAQLVAGQVVPLEGIAVLRERVAQALRGQPRWMWKIMVLGINEPSLQVSPGQVITGPHKGTVGTPVKWSAGSGFMTAGHVTPSVGTDVFENTMKIGSVAWANDPAHHGTSIEPDVAVVELLSGMSASSNLTGPSLAGPNAPITVVSSGATDTVIGFNAFLYMTGQNATCGDIYMTGHEITQPGDSGGPVVLSNGTGTDVIGHVVGGSSNVTSFIQDMQYQLREASNPARHGLAGLRM
jgi:hypothetical protein